VLMRGELKKLQRTLNITTIYVTHDQVEAMSMSDRVAVMNRGRVLQVDSPDNLYNRPQDVFVATFIGSPPMNMITCELVEEPSGLEYVVPLEYAGSILGEGRVKTSYVLDCQGVLRLPIAPLYAKQLISQGAKSVYLGIRPEHVEISKSIVLESFTTVKVKVDVVEALGSENIVNVLIGGDLVKARTPGTMKLEPGEEVYLKINPKKTLIFDKQTGKLII